MERNTLLAVSDVPVLDKRRSGRERWRDPTSSDQNTSLNHKPPSSRLTKLLLRTTTRPLGVAGHLSEDRRTYLPLRRAFFPGMSKN
jgi:hypothetical protein